MQRRNFERIPTNLKVRFFSGNIEYPGTVTNVSDKGMFISTEVSFPLEPKLEIFIPLKEEVLKIPVKIKSFKKSGDIYNGIGVELLDPSPHYLHFINDLRFML
jgi:hypothetical protein